MAGDYIARVSEQGRGGAWHPRGPGLLLAVVTLSVVALVAHTVLAFTVWHSAAVAAPSPSAAGPATAQTPAAPGAAPLHLSHSCLVADNPPTTAKVPADDAFGADLSHFGTGAELQRLYAVKDAALVPIDGAGPVRDCDQQLWQVVVETTPARLLTELDEFMVFDADLHSSSDGAFVGEVEPRPTGSPQDPDAARDSDHWRLAIAPNGATDVEVAITVAHEIGHLLSLNGGQLDPAQSPSGDGCETFDTGDGCLSDDSLLLAYLDDTWSQDLVDEWYQAFQIDDDTKRLAALQSFHDKHADLFVSSYAATDPAEDFAESFAFWCAIGPGSPLLADVVEGDASNGHTKLAWMDDPANRVAPEQLPDCQRLRALTS